MAVHQKKETATSVCNRVCAPEHGLSMEEEGPFPCLLLLPLRGFKVAEDAKDAGKQHVHPFLCEQGQTPTSTLHHTPSSNMDIPMIVASFQLRDDIYA
jgi:hypothetical protein